jgi:hypothetical protein
MAAGAHMQCCRRYRQINQEDPNADAAELVHLLICITHSMSDAWLAYKQVTKTTESQREIYIKLSEELIENR